MQTKFMMGHTSVDVVKIQEDQIRDELPAGVYTVCYTDLRGFYLTINKELLELPEKIYGNVMQRVEKCLTTYKDRSTSTGILLTGDKGTGKSLFMALLANEVVKQLNMPILIIRDGFCGSQFTSFIEEIGECCMVFDEFGKTYPAGYRGDPSTDKQKDLLTLMDGIDKTKRMFIMTENSELDINDFMLNRPSRIYYHFKYTKLDEASIVDYCEDKGVADTPTRDILEISRRSRIFSFDMLQTIVEEHTRFGTNIEDCVNDLNISLKDNLEELIDVIKIIDKETNEEIEVLDKDAQYRKPGRNTSTYIRIKTDESNKLTAEVKQAELSKELIEFIESETYDYEEIYISDNDLARQEGDKLVYDNNAYVIYAKEVPTKSYSYWAF